MKGIISTRQKASDRLYCKEKYGELSNKKEQRKKLPGENV